jgi:twitching motility protein PilT
MAGIDVFLEFMVTERASDLHLGSGNPAIYRIDGSIVRTESQALSSDDIQGLLEEIMPERNKLQFGTTHDTDFAYEISGLGRFRVNVFMDLNGVGAVFRLIPAKIRSFDELALPDSVRELCKLSKGLVLVTGPTGSGKSTTLAAMIDYINETRNEHIITIEDPVEFVHQNKSCLINHREIHRHTEGFKPALRAALREDPDIVLIGEMRDLETIEIAIETAETGHLVFGTLHTTTAPSTVSRIIDQFPADRQSQIRMMLSESLKGVVAQTLLKKNGGGRVAALEILIGNSALANLIRENKIHQIPSVMQTGQKSGMQMLNSHIFDWIEKGDVEISEAMLKAVDKEDLRLRLKTNGYDIP